MKSTDAPLSHRRLADLGEEARVQELVRLKMGDAGVRVLAFESRNEREGELDELRNLDGVYVERTRDGRAGAVEMDAWREGLAEAFERRGMSRKKIATRRRSCVSS